MINKMTYQDVVENDELLILFPRVAWFKGYCSTFEHRTNVMFTPVLPKFYDFQVTDISVCYALPKRHWPECFIINDAPYGWIIIAGNSMLHRDVVDFNVAAREVTLAARNKHLCPESITISINEIREVYKIIGTQRGIVDEEDLRSNIGYLNG